MKFLSMAFLCLLSTSAFAAETADIERVEFQDEGTCLNVDSLPCSKTRLILDSERRASQLETRSISQENRIDEIEAAGGIEGPQGPSGTNGAPGTNGIDGIDGIDGAPGPMGPPGLQGDIGPQGLTGPAGADGAADITPLVEAQKEVYIEQNYQSAIREVWKVLQATQGLAQNADWDVRYADFDAWAGEISKNQPTYQVAAIGAGAYNWQPDDANGLVGITLTGYHSTRDLEITITRPAYGNLSAASEIVKMESFDGRFIVDYFEGRTWLLNRIEAELRIMRIELAQGLKTETDVENYVLYQFMGDIQNEYGTWTPTAGIVGAVPDDDTYQFGYVAAGTVQTGLTITITPPDVFGQYQDEVFTF